MGGLCPSRSSVPVRIAALYATGKLAAPHGEFHAAVTRLRDAQAFGGPGPGRSPGWAAATTR